MQVSLIFILSLVQIMFPLQLQLLKIRCNTFDLFSVSDSVSLVTWMENYFDFALITT